MPSLINAVNALRCCSPMNVDKKDCHNCIFKYSRPDCHVAMTNYVIEAITTEVAASERVRTTLSHVQAELQNLYTV